MITYSSDLRDRNVPCLKITYFGMYIPDTWAGGVREMDHHLIIPSATCLPYREARLATNWACWADTEFGDFYVLSSSLTMNQAVTAGIASGTNIRVTANTLPDQIMTSQANITRMLYNAGRNCRAYKVADPTPFHIPNYIRR